MPTGYTDPIKDGIGFNEFVMRCARAFGALISMRDMGLDASLPEKFDPSTKYHDNALIELDNNISDLERMTEEEVVKKIEEEYTSAVKRRDEYLQTASVLRSKYESMLRHVREWNPPTPDHEELKRFMIEQIEESIKFDCPTDMSIGAPVKFKGTATEWRGERLLKLHKDRVYHTEKILEEIVRTRECNEWLRVLRSSLS